MDLGNMRRTDDRVSLGAPTIRGLVVGGRHQSEVRHVDRLEARGSKSGSSSRNGAIGSKVS